MLLLILFIMPLTLILCSKHQKQEKGSKDAIIVNTTVPVSATSKQVVMEQEKKSTPKRARLNGKKRTSNIRMQHATMAVQRSKSSKSKKATGPSLKTTPGKEVSGRKGKTPRGKDAATSATRNRYNEFTAEDSLRCFSEKESYYLGNIDYMRNSIDMGKFIDDELDSDNNEVTAEEATDPARSPRFVRENVVYLIADIQSYEDVFIDESSCSAPSIKSKIEGRKTEK